MLDQAKLAVVAYAEVVGSNGTSTLTNSGVYTTRISSGLYQIDLSKNPDGTPSQQDLKQFSDRDLIVVTPNPTTQDMQSNFFVYACANSETGGAIKNVGLGAVVDQGGVHFSAVDCDFSFIIYRTLTPPTSSGPA